MVSFDIGSELSASSIFCCSSSSNSALVETDSTFRSSISSGSNAVCPYSLVRNNRNRLFASDSLSNLRSANFRSPIFRVAPISQSNSFERKIGNREFLLLFAVKK